jgi:hypothetical protein
MKTVLRVFAVLMLIGVVGAAVAAGLFMLGAATPVVHGVHMGGVSHGAGAAFGLMVAAVAVMFAMVVTILALAGAFLAVICALVMTGLILLALALPFLLPLIIPLAVILTVVLLAGRPNRRRAA